MGYVISIFLGLVLGSFAGAQVWRLRAVQLCEDKSAGDDYDKKEFKKLSPLLTKKVSDDHSRCLRCGHQLAWFDLIPLLSWLSTGGKCRYCKKAIGWFEPAMEIGTAVLFVLLYHHFAASWYMLPVWCVIAVLFMILLAYDAKWLLLPDKIMWPLIALSSAVAVYTIAQSLLPFDTALSTAGAVAILSGLYLLLWVISKGAWIGFGDVKLGLALGLLLADWQLAFLTLFLANVIGLLFAVPSLLRKQASGKTQIPFGPMLILGFFIALFCGTPLIDGYFTLTNSVVDNLLML